MAQRERLLDDCLRAAQQQRGRYNHTSLPKERLRFTKRKTSVWHRCKKVAHRCATLLPAIIMAIMAPETARKIDRSADTRPARPIRAWLCRFAAIPRRASETAAAHPLRRACANRPDRLRPGSPPCGKSPLPAAYDRPTSPEASAHPVWATLFVC